MPPLPVKRPLRTIVAGLAVGAVVVAGWLSWRHGRAPGDEEVAAYLNRTTGGGHLRFSVDHREILPLGDAGQQLTVVATARTFEPLYAKIDAAEYLGRTGQLAPETAAEARRLLSDPGASLRPDFREAAPFPADPFQASILRVSTPAGASFAFHGVVNARRTDGTWNFVLVSGSLAGGGPAGETRSAFGDAALVAGEAGDEARLRVLATDFAAFAGRVARIRHERESAHSAAIESRRQAFLAQLAPGRVFRGVAAEAGTQRETPLYLEIAGLGPDHEVSMLLRNEGSWHVARVFQGTWSADEQFEKPVLHLASLPGQAVRGAGPFLENTQEWTFALNVDSRGELEEQNQFFHYRFQPLAPEQAVALQARLEAEYGRAITATEPGSIFIGAAVSRTSGESEPVLLRFERRPSGGDTLDAKIESTLRAWKRPLHGSIMTNARRSGGAPIRLRTNPAEAVEEAPNGSILGDRGELELRLGIDQASLVGGDERFTYRLAAAGTSDLEHLEADRRERARRFGSVMLSGIVYDGLMREDQGFVAQARIEFVRIDRPTGAVAVRIRSLTKPNIFREFLGTVDPAGDSMVLGATDRGALDKTLGFNIPFLLSPAATSLHLVLAGTSIMGRIEGDPRWALEFPAATFLAAPTESMEASAPLAGGGVLPVLPKEEGAYVFSGGAWVLLPANQGHVVVEPVQRSAGGEGEGRGDGEGRGGGGGGGGGGGMPTNLRGLIGLGVGEVTKGSRKKKDKPPETVSYLEFDGKDPRPAAHGPVVVLLLVGPPPAGTSAVELAPVETLNDGRRRVKIAGDSPTAIKLKELPLAAYVRQVAPGSLLLTTTSTPAPGSYIFSAGGGFELTVD